MKTTNLATAVLLAGLLAGLLTGCEAVHQYSLTYKLWNNDELRNFSEPATDPRTALYLNPVKDDLLVAYDESRENSSQLQRRAYYLKPNLDRIANNQEPHFVDPRTAASLEPVPPAATVTNTPSDAACVFTTSKNGREFTVLRGATTEGPYELPVYARSQGTALRLALTPVAVVGDTVMVGLVASLAALIMACQAGASGSL